MKSLILFSIVLFVIGSFLITQFEDEEKLQAYLDKSVPFVGTQIIHESDFDGTGINYCNN